MGKPCASQSASAGAACRGGNGHGKLQLVEPFQDKSQAGVLLFLKCCYLPAKIKRLMGESLREEPSETPLHELLLLTNHFQVRPTLGCVLYMCSYVGDVP